MARKFQAISTMTTSVKCTFYHSVTCCALLEDPWVFNRNRALLSRYCIRDYRNAMDSRLSMRYIDNRNGRIRGRIISSSFTRNIPTNATFLRLKWERSCKTRTSVVPNKCEIFRIPRAKNPRTIREEHNRIKEFFRNKMQTDASSPFSLSAKPNACGSSRRIYSF